MANIYQRAMGVLCLSALAIGRASASEIIHVNPTVQYQAVDGWGTCLCWWANFAGGYPEPVREKIMDSVFDPVKGLGLNVVRYNIGGGENPDLHLLPARTKMPGFEPRPGQWDWRADANQQWILQAAVRRGANHLEACSNSPPWWMTQSLSVTGAHKAKDDNLRPDQFEAFADFLTTVVQHFHDDLGITFETLEPFNEPIAPWWVYGVNQEGCHFELASQARLIDIVARALAAKKLKTRIAASDENTIDQTANAFRSYPATTRAEIWRINSHGYGGHDRAGLNQLAITQNKGLWLSEYGDADASGITMSMEILKDMKKLRPTAWVNWQVADPAGGWGLFSGSVETAAGADWKANEKYYVFGNYTRFIRPGYRMIEIDDPYSLAAIDPSARTLVIVKTNPTQVDADFTCDLARVGFKDALIADYLTSPHDNLARQNAPAIHDGTFHATAFAKSVTTFVVSSVDVPRGDRP